ncbi:NAD(P)H-hydrate dehydratase [Geojedonia litorea]|uniref:Bifunctional NAD(P)H-hydrate repair enzyme n=1 Tax=Geojedonia litorea TaxID=1268269 RepID=A0ABV9N5G5_9FLAO
MKILSKEQIYKADELTVKKQQIASADLMERAGMQIFNWLHMRIQGAQVPVHVFCGIGNNGGDGLVIARHLVTHGYNVKTYVVNCSDKRSKDFLINYDLIKQTTKEWPTLLSCKEDFPSLDKKDIIIDAVFGIGLNRPADDWIKGLFQHFRASKAFTLAVDIPSGLYMDKVPEDENGVVWANFTLSFQSAKLVFFLPQTAKFTQHWDVLDIGLDQDYLSIVETNIELIGKYEVLPLYKPRAKFSHKGDYGHALIIGGSYGKIGAVTLASRGALSSGAGLITAFIPKCGYNALQASFPEAMVITDSNTNHISDIKFEINARAIGIGVGLGTENYTLVAFENFLKENKKPLVLDADALNLLSIKKSLLKLIPKQTVLTPHSKELERLIGAWTDDFDKLEKVKVLSKKYQLIIVIKGAHTVTVFLDTCYINTTGNPGLATAGSGDVLTGIITGLIAQGYEPLVATIFGVYLHGRAADIAVESTGYQSLIASDVIETLSSAYLDLFAQPEPQEQSSTNEETN